MQLPPKKKLHGDCHFLYYFSKYPNTPSASKHGQAFGILPGISLCPLIRTPGKIFTIRISNKINCSVCSGVRVSAGRRPHPARPHNRYLCCNGSRGGSVHPLPEACGAGSRFRHDGYKMIPHRAETSRFVVTEQLLGGVIPGGACGAAMNDDIFHGSGGCHHRAVLLSEESTFVRNLFLTDYHRESFLNHG